VGVVQQPVDGGGGEGPSTAGPGSRGPFSVPGEVDWALGHADAGHHRPVLMHDAEQVGVEGREDLGSGDVGQWAAGTDDARVVDQDVQATKARGRDLRRPRCSLRRSRRWG